MQNRTILLSAICSLVLIGIFALLQLTSSSSSTSADWASSSPSTHSLLADASPSVGTGLVPVRQTFRPTSVGIGLVPVRQTLYPTLHPTISSPSLTTTSTSSTSAPIFLTSNARLHTVGGGAGTNALGNRANHGTRQNGAGTANTALPALRAQTTLAMAANNLSLPAETTAPQGDPVLQGAGKDDDTGDPFREPIGALPIGWMLLLACGQALRIQQRKKKNNSL